jgi:hypothetical protein
MDALGIPVLKHTHPSISAGNIAHPSLDRMQTSEFLSAGVEFNSGTQFVRLVCVL